MFGGISPEAVKYALTSSGIDEYFSLVDVKT
jgi:hypothetical protein